MDPKCEYLEAAIGTSLSSIIETQFEILISKTGVINQVICEDEVVQYGNDLATLEH